MRTYESWVIDRPSQRYLLFNKSQFYGGIGLKTYLNQYHNNHLYIKIEDHEISHLQSTVFEELIEKHHRPLQVMVPSDAEQLIGILEQSGFRLRRKCYEMDVCAADLISHHSIDFTALSEARKGTPDWAECAEMMYAYYAETHKQINPLTATRADFDEILPDTVLYITTDDPIDAAAFIEGNEIVYLFSHTKDSFFYFADLLLSYMFSKYDRIIFEADDSDWAATGLKEMFFVLPMTSYNTYIKPVKESSI